MYLDTIVITLHVGLTLSFDIGGVLQP